MVEVTGSLRKFDDIWYTIEKVVYSRGELSGFTSEDIYDSLRDKSFFKGPEDLNKYLIDNGEKFRLRPAETGWERFW